MAVPAPSSTAATAHTPKLVPAATRPIAAAWTSIPATMSHFRPIRSDSAPVASCPAPQMAGYRAARTPIWAMVRPWRANRIGNRPQATPSLRLLTMPAWQAADRAGSEKLVSQATWRVVRCPPR